MDIAWGDILQMLKIWSAYIGLYGVLGVSVIAIGLLIHTRLTKDTSCNIKLLRKILS